MGFHLLAKDRDDAAQLHDVRRFRHEWERAASVDLRDGRADAADTYFEHGRVEGGDRESMLDLLYEAWRDDTSADAWGRRGRFERDAHEHSGSDPDPQGSRSQRRTTSEVDSRNASNCTTTGPGSPGIRAIEVRPSFSGGLRDRGEEVLGGEEACPARRAGARSLKRWGPRTALEICEWRSTREPGLDVSPTLTKLTTPRS